MLKVQISGVHIFTGYSQAEKEQILKDLTLPNPAYQSARNFGRAGIYTRISKTLEYYKDMMGHIVAPRGYMPPFPYTIIEDSRKENEFTPYPKFHITFRPTQIEAMDAYFNHLKGNDPHGIVVLPTGKGKTIMGLCLGKMLGQKMLVIVQKDDLVTGWTKDAKLVYGLRPKQVGLIKAGEFRIGQQITLATVQTLARMTATQLKFLRNQFGMLIVDEFHHSAAKIYEIITFFPAKYRIGLTATPSRNDGLTKALEYHFGKVAFEFKDTGGDEDIMPVNVIIRNVMISPVIEQEIVRVKKKDGTIEESLKEINIHQVREATCYEEEFMEMLCSDVIDEYKLGKSCIVFSHERDHLSVLYNRLTRLGVAEDTIQLYVGGENKVIAMERAESKKALITLATFHIATEGTNVKAWERGFLASSIANANDTIQSIGRLRRRLPNKPDVIVYDYRFPLVPKAENHGRVRDKVYKERNFTVEGKEFKKSRKKSGRGFSLFNKQK